MSATQKFTNSPLVDYTRFSPCYTKNRKHNIDHIAIHCVVGQLSVEAIGACFAYTRIRASSNYGVGFDGRIGQYVNEKDRSWCTSSGAVDHRAITIEVACNPHYPYEVNDVAYEALIKLVADICKRNNIKKLLWQADKTLFGQVDKQNMAVHRWFNSNKSCPGEYLYNKHYEIAHRVNVLLGVEDKTVEDDKGTDNEIKVNDIITIKSGSYYYNGKAPVPSWVSAKEWYVAQITGDKVIIGKSVDGKNNINSPINIKYVTKKSATIQKPTQESYVIYYVKRGDTLSAIALKYKTTVSEIARLNNIINPNRISINQKLKIPVR